MPSSSPPAPKAGILRNVGVAMANLDFVEAVCLILFACALGWLASPLVVVACAPVLAIKLHGALQEVRHEVMLEDAFQAASARWPEHGEAFERLRAARMERARAEADREVYGFNDWRAP